MANEIHNRFDHFESGLNSLSGAISSQRVFIQKIQAQNNSGDLRYLQFFDTGSLPTAGNVPRVSYMVPASGTLQLEYLSARHYPTGSVFSWSSTYATLTVGAFTQLSLEVEYLKG